MERVLISVVAASFKKKAKLALDSTIRGSGLVPIWLVESMVAACGLLPKAKILLPSWLSITYFFQAEDGIRDRLVTGVRRVLFRSRYDFVVRSTDAAIWVSGARPKGKGFDLSVDARIDTGRWLEVTGVLQHGRG